jgi:superfamily II DNA or RNA helicase
MGLFGGDVMPILPAKALRPYQLKAVESIRRELDTNRSTLLVLPTGTGKTRTFSEIAKDWPGKVVVIAHRTELITQARGALEENCGELVSTEKAEQRADGSRIVVASVQTLVGERLASFARRHPATLVICDEAHHAVSPSYRSIFDAFGAAKVLGVTATPDRSDERAMGQVFDSVAFVYEIRDAIKDGYLCPIRIKRVTCGEIDLSSVGTVAGDLNQGELDAVMTAENVLHKIVAPNDDRDSLIDLAAQRSTIVFCTSVDMAHRMAEVINRYKPDSARAVDGTTHDDTRRLILADHKAGRFQFLCNVGVLTEGYDSPGVSCVAMCRPTKSRALYAQCAGRGLRILEGKADCLLLDFVGASGKHRLVSGLDILAGTYDDEVVEKARDIIESQGMDGGMLAEDALEKAQRQLEEARAREAAKRLAVKVSKVKRQVVDVDPFAFLDVADPDTDPKYAAYRAPATDGQKAALTKAGIEHSPDISKRQASALLDGLKVRREMGLCTVPQYKKLEKRGVANADKLTFVEAGKLMGHLGSEMAKHNWQFRFTPELVTRLLGQRDAGWEG